jgi:hypothetical protein
MRPRGTLLSAQHFWPVAGLVASLGLVALAVGVWWNEQVQTGFGWVLLVLFSISALCTLIAALGLLRSDCTQRQNRRFSTLRWLAAGVLVTAAIPVIVSIGLFILAADAVIVWAAIGADRACGRPVLPQLVLGACGMVGAAVVLAIPALSLVQP